MRQADGSIARFRIEESTHEITRVRALRAAQDRADYYHEQAYRPKPKASPSFKDAALTYVKTVGKKRFVDELAAHFGDTPIAEIDQEAIANAAHVLYPGRTASTHNRAVFAPAVTILRLSGQRPNIKRPKIIRKPVTIPPEDWFDAVLPHCPPRLAALLVFLTLTGRRITEALEAIDNGDGTVTIPRTKTGEPVRLDMPSLVGDYLRRSGWVLGRNGTRLFPYGDRYNVYRALRQACKRAGVPFYGTHALGRHAFATRLLREGKSLKFVADAGGWASIKMPAQHYAHLEHSEVQEETRKVGDRWGRKREKARKANENKQ